MVLERDGFACRYCGRRPPEVTLEVDHWVPRERHGSDSLNNLRSACRDCNRGKGALYWGEHPSSGPILARQRRPIVKPPLGYQLAALRQLIDAFRERGVETLTVDELAAALERPVLRDGLDPMYEPLTLVTSSEALAELNEMGELVAASDGTLRMPAIQS